MRLLPISETLESAQGWIKSWGIAGPIVFGLIYVTATVLFVPGSVITFAGASMFGFWTGLITISISSTLGAGLAFLIARYVARSKVQQLAASNEKFHAIDEAISEGGWKVVGLLRLSPAVPFNLQNYLFGLTNIPFWQYLITSWIAMMPGTFLYVYIGNLAGAAATGESYSVWRWGLLIVGLLATLGVTIYVTRLAQAKLKKKT